jgi:YidC/Oxa1 family membrane protein insertase
VVGGTQTGAGGLEAGPLADTHMEKRVLVAVVLSFLVLYLYQAFLAPPPPKTRPKPAAAAQQAQGTTPTAAAGGQAQAATTNAAVGAAPAAPAPATLVGETSEREFAVETPLVRAVFTNAGGRVKHWELKKYHDEQGRHVDLVPTGISPILPFSLETGDGAIDGRVNAAFFKVVEDGSAGSDTTPRKVVFEYRDSAGITARKSFELSPTTYTVAFKAEMTVGSAPANLAVVMGPGLGDVQTSTGTSYSQKANGLVHQAGKVTRFSAQNIVAQASHQGTWDYAGMDDHYFASVALLDGKTDAGIRFRHYWVAKTPQKADHDFVSYVLNPAGTAVNLNFFLGPKEFGTLQGVNRDLVRSINFGMFAWLAVPLLQALNGVNKYLHNYGWSIIALTVLINLAIFPLRHKSFVSMRKMQALQPQVKAIQDRYGKLKATDPDRQKMNTEMMQLYKDKGVNPASGCVPILLTMPLLFAFYSLLSAAIELRGAPFALWITNLAVHDPLYVTPVLMGITMLIQQKMTPTQSDPVQQKMMMFMPVIFTAMFLRAPSGLAIYWFVSNLLAIGQQYATNRMLAPVSARDLRPSTK